MGSESSIMDTGFYSMFSPERRSQSQSSTTDIGFYSMFSPERRSQSESSTTTESGDEKSVLHPGINVSHLPPIKNPYNKACNIYVDLLPQTYTTDESGDEKSVHYRKN